MINRCGWTKGIKAVKVHSDVGLNEVEVGEAGVGEGEAVKI